jgi:hypothetical protein
MKKVLWLIVCLITMAAFSGCTTNDYTLELDDNTIVGEWIDIDYGTRYFFYNGIVENITDGIRCEYKLQQDRIIFIETDDYGKKHHIYAYFISKSLYDMSFTIGEEIYNLHRTSKHSNF